MAIVGGGAVGLLAAIAMAKQNRAVHLFEPAQDRPIPPRAIALTPASLRYLRKHQVLTATDGIPIQGIELSVQGQPGHAQLEHPNDRQEPIGRIVPLPQLIQSLRAVIADTPAITVIPKAVEQLTPCNKGWVLVAGEHTLRAQVVLGCDGAESLLRRVLNLGVIEQDYQQSGLVGRVRFERSHGGIAIERFGDHDVLALLPLADGAMSYVWAFEREDARAIAAGSVEAYQARLAQSMNQRFGRVLEISPPHEVPFIERTAPHRVARRAVLFGHAAHTLHPIGAQGLNLSIREIERWAQQVDGAPDIGAASLTMAFEAAVQDDVRQTQKLTRWLAHKVNGPWLPNWVKSIGLWGLNARWGIQKPLLRYLMGETRVG